MPLITSLRQLPLTALRQQPLISRQSRRYASALTVVNPSKSIEYYVQQVSASARAVVIAATPDHASQLLDHISRSKTLTAGFVVDTVPVGCQRHGLSILALDAEFTVTDEVKLLEEHFIGRASWTPSQSFVGLGLEGRDIVVPGANTLFENGHLATIAYTGSPLLSSMRLVVPHKLDGETQAMSPLVQIGEPDLEVTSARNNLVKALNGMRAAGFLEQIGQLQAVDGKSIKVFATIKSVNGRNVRSEVQAGGGGSWNPRTGILALEPETVVKAGDRLTFWMHDQSAEFASEQAFASFTPASLQVLLETSPVLETLSESTGASERYLDHTFSLGAEKGFMVDNARYAVARELVLLQ